MDQMEFPVEKNISLQKFQYRIKPATICKYFWLISRILLFGLAQRGRQKTQGCARFSRKSYVARAKIPETRRTSSNSSNFFTPSPLVFRLTGRGQASKQRHYIGGRPLLVVVRS
jgi:hypothetical protein